MEPLSIIGVCFTAPLPCYSAPARDRPHISLLTFRGHMAVHGLFDFLLEACGSSAAGGAGSGVVTRGSGRGDGGGTRSGDVPLLLSREPFLNASLKALKVRSLVLRNRVYRARLVWHVSIGDEVN